MSAPVPVSMTTTDGVRLTGLQRPLDGAPACVVAHGFTGSAGNAWISAICDRLHDHGFAVLAPDLRGHGGSGGRSTAGIAEARDVAAAVAFARGEGARQVVTLGWSMGATAVLRHAGLGGDTDAVVSVSAPGLWWERGTRPMRLVHWMFETRSGRLAARLARRTRIAAEGWDVEPEPPVDVAARIAPTPLLLVHGDADHYFPLRHVEALGAAAPHAAVWIEPGMGHAENATTPGLVDRIAGWAVEALGRTRRWSDGAGVCDHDRHERADGDERGHRRG